MRFAFAAASLFVLSCALGAVPENDEPQRSLAPAGQTGELPPDPAIADYRKDLLDLAFSAASSVPLNPHAKTRASLQESVVQTCLELGQARRAAAYSDAIEGWRRGACYADCATHCARAGADADAQRFLGLATLVMDSPETGITQDWQRDRIRSKLALANLCLGRSEQALVLEQGLEESERAELAAERARLAGAGELEAVLAAVDEAVNGGSFEFVRRALESCAVLFDRLYEEPELRDRAQAKLVSSCGTLPILVRVELMERLAKSALAHSDGPKALALVAESETIVAGAAWTPRHEVPVRARLAALRHRGGDAAGARAALTAASAAYEAGLQRIVDIDRADALLALAEAEVVLADGAAAQARYARALEAAVANPNSRPRAEDLCAILLSLAARGVEPSAELSRRILEIHAGLGDPW